MELTSLNSVSGEEKEVKLAKLKRVCAEFESLFLYELMKKMEKTIPKSGILAPMSGKDTYRMMMDQKVAEEIARRGGIGLGYLLFTQLKK